MRIRKGCSNKSYQFDRPTLLCFAMCICLLSVFVALPWTAYAQSTDNIEPEIVHESSGEAIPGLKQTFTAIVTDDIAVQSVTLLYRVSLDSDFVEKTMIIDNEPSRYVADIMVDPGTAKIEYYIEAIDTAGNTKLRGNSLFALNRSIADSSLKKNNRRTVLYSVLGVVAAGALISLANNDDNEPESGCISANGCTVNIGIPRPN